MLIQNPLTNKKSIRIDIDSPYAKKIFQENFLQLLCDKYFPGPIVILCIGTDRSTGDSLGPLVGERLKLLYPTANVYGNLADPVHAANLDDVLNQIYNKFKNPFIIAVDASLGRKENVGTIKLSDGALKPGAGVNKNLPEVGEFHVTGIVNIGGFMEYFVLQNTRLYTVMKMADIIAEGISRGLKTFLD